MNRSEEMIGLDTCDKIVRFPFCFDGVRALVLECLPANTERYEIYNEKRTDG
jgi:hypothetical protein